MSQAMSAGSKMSPQQSNDAIRAYLLSNSLEMKQQIYSGTITPSAGNVVNIPMRAVGLVKGFIVECTASVSNSGGSTATLTNLGAANVLSNVTITDLDGYQRINTTGWHLHLLGTAKEGWPFGAALLSTATDAPVKYGNNLSVISASPTIAASGTGTITMRYWVPMAYSKSDLRGAMFAGVVNATAYLQLTINPTPGVTTGDSINACYSGASTSTSFTSVAITVYQVYLDQIPRYTQGPNAGKPILPPLDVLTQYRLLNTSLTGLTTSQDFPIPFTNFQQFLSATCIYDQNGTFNAGTDINYFALTTANTLQQFKVGPFTQGLLQRVKYKTDLPTAVYMFDFRSDPINTNQTGNIQLVLNPSSVASSSSVLVGWESFAMVNTLLGAASLAAS